MNQPMPIQQPIVEIKINHPKQLVPDTKPDVHQLLMWREEAMLASADWRAESWRDNEMYDGKQWSDTDSEAAKDAGLPYLLTINHTFPTVNLILGSQIVNKYDITAKARTRKDSEIGQVMTEGIKYVMDQWDGEFKITQAFRDGVIPGIGWLTPAYSGDPRRERVKVSYRDWKEVWWDPYSSPWVDIDTTRYMFTQRWMDITDLQAIFYEKAKEIDEVIDDLSNTTTKYTSIWDEASQVEELIRYSTGTGWVSSNRKRIRPCEMWYTNYVTAMFAIFPNGNVQEINPTFDPMQQFEMIRQAQEVVTANVKKLRVATFIGNLHLADVESPYTHDQYPYVPFVGYIDRFNFPYGVPRQLRDQEEEINRRRSMALALINSRRIIMEEDAASAEMSIQDLYNEANKPDGFLIVKPGAIARNQIMIVDQTKLMPPQIELMKQSELEIQQISGANAEQLGYKSNAISGAAIRERKTQGATTTASLFDNLRRSLKILGNQVTCLIQGSWTGEKVLRVTDRLSGAEKYVEINKRIRGADGQIMVRNDITQNTFDVVISQEPISDTVREQNVNLIIEWVKKSPPEIIPQLILVALEMSNIPDKDRILEKIKPLLGDDPTEEDMTAEERKQRLVQKLQAQAEEQKQITALKMADAQLTIQGKELENKKTEAETSKIYADIQAVDDKNAITQDKNEVQRERIRLEGTKIGYDMAAGAEKNNMEREKTAHDMKINENKHDLDRIKAGHDMAMASATHEAELAQQNFDRKMMLETNRLKVKEMKADENKSGSIGGE